MTPKAFSKIPKLLLILGALVRAIGLGASAIWQDEAVTFWRVTRFPLFGLSNQFSEQSGDILLELVLRPLLHISCSLWMLRLPSLLASFGCLWLVWKLMQQLRFTPKQQILTAALVAFLPGLIWMAQDSRSYSALSLFFLAALYFACTCRWLGMTACLGLMMYCHNTAPAFILGILLVAVITFPQHWWAAIKAAPILFLAYLPQAWAAWHYRGTTLSPMPPLSLIEATVSTVLGFWVGSLPNILAAIFPILLIVSLYVLLLEERTQTTNILMLAWIIPFLVLGLLSTYSNVFIYRTIMPFILPYLMALGWSLGHEASRRMIGWRWVLSSVWIILLAVGFTNWNPATRGASVDRIASEIRADWQPGDVIIYTTQTVATPFDY